MIERAKQLKNTLNGLVNDFNKIYSKINFFSKKIKLTEKLSIPEEITELFVVIKKYLFAIESERLLSGYMTALRQEIKKNDVDGSLFGENFKTIKNSKTKSYNWLYYDLFKSMVGEVAIYAPSMKKCLDTVSLAPLQKAMIDNDFDGGVKTMIDNEKEIIDLKLDIFLNPKLHKKYLAYFHKSIISWLDAYIMTLEYSSNTLSRDPRAEKWEDIKIGFKNYHDVKLVIDGKEEDSSYDKLGFADNRQDSITKAVYVKSWELLILFATQNSKIKSISYSGKQKGLFNKDRLDLSSKLKNYFGLKDSPIIYNESKQEYQILIKLTPAPEFRDSWHDRNTFETNKKTFLGNY